MIQLEEVSYKRWLNLWEMLDAPTNPRPVYEYLIKRYAEPHRKYHTLQHILFCLQEFDNVRNRVDGWQAIPTVELALWYHDAVYDTRALDNEEQSGRLVVQVCLNAFLGNLGAHAARLIMATRHTAKPEDRNAGLMVDVDLAILGQLPDVFDAYEVGIRQEYAWVPDEQFRNKRAEILQSFLDRSSIYTSDYFYDRYEQRAKANLKCSIQALLK